MSGPEEFYASEDEAVSEPRARPTGKPPKPPRDEDPRPFVERYRGTEFDQVPATMPVAQRRRGIPLTWTVLIGGVLVLLAISVSVVFMLVGQRKPTGLAEFRNGTPARVYVRPAATAAASSSVAPTAMPTAVAQPWRSDPSHPATLFIAQMTRPDLTYHLAAGAGITAASEPMHLEYDMDVAGNDYAVTVELTAGGTATVMDMVVKNGTFYGRVDGGEWARADGAPPAGESFGEATASSWQGVEYIGPEIRSGKRLHHLRLPVYSWPGPADRAFVVVRAPSVFVWDVWVDETGRPRTAEISFEMTVRMYNQNVALTFDFDYRFSKVGKPITISVPLEFR